MRQIRRKRAEREMDIDVESASRKAEEGIKEDGGKRWRMG